MDPAFISTLDIESNITQIVHKYHTNVTLILWTSQLAAFIYHNYSLRSTEMALFCVRYKIKYHIKVYLFFILSDEYSG